jgi:hypothetical protein
MNKKLKELILMILVLFIIAPIVFVGSCIPVLFGLSLYSDGGVQFPENLSIAVLIAILITALIIIGLFYLINKNSNETS